MACKRSAVRSRLPPPKVKSSREEFEVCWVFAKGPSGSSKVLTLSSRGLGHHPFTVATGVRIPLGSPEFITPRVRCPRRKLTTAGPQGQRDLARKSECCHYQE